MRSIVAILISTALAVLSAGNAFALDADQIERWKEDLEVYHDTLRERHIDLYHSVSRDRFEDELDSLIDALPSLREHQVIFELMRITRLIGDGHTQLPIMAGPHTHYPLRFRLFGGDVRLIAAAAEYKAHLGSSVVAIGGIPIAEVLSTLSPAVQGVENEYSLLSSLAFHLTVDNMLYAAGITANPGSADFSFENDAGVVTTTTVVSVPMREFTQRTRHRIETVTNFGDPLIEVSDGLWLALSKTTESAYLYFAGYPSFDDMVEFAQRVREQLEKERIRNIIVDFRDNGGGDFYNGLALSHAILMTESIDWNHGVYVLIGRDTISAAMSNAVQFRQILNARLVGEPTGSNPVGYQELGRFHLPHSNRMVFHSKRLYRFQDTATSGVQPDVQIETDADAFVAGIDQALEWIIEDIRTRAQ